MFLIDRGIRRVSGGGKRGMWRQKDQSYLDACSRRGPLGAPSSALNTAILVGHNQVRSLPKSFPPSTPEECLKFTSVHPEDVSTHK